MEAISIHMFGCAAHPLKSLLSAALNLNTASYVISPVKAVNSAELLSTFEALQNLLFPDTGTYGGNFRAIRQHGTLTVHLYNFFGIRSGLVS